MKLEWQAEEIIRAVRGNSLQEQIWSASGVAIDSRAVHPGDLFIALQGPTNDAHNYVAQAFANGAVAALVHRNPPQVASDRPLVMVENTFTALQDLGRVGRQRTQAKILAVTGSVGKTSSKEQLRLMLGACGDTYANEGSFNNHWGVPLSLARLPQDAKWGVFEMGMNHAGEITPLTREVMPSVSLITNIEAVHLEFFANLDAIADAKAEIFLGMGPDGTAVLNRDNPQFARLVAAARTQGLRRILSFGHEAKADAHLVECRPDQDGSLVTAEVLGHKLHYRIATPGEHIAMNSLGALLCAEAAGADLILCAEALAAFRPLYRRGTRDKITLPDGGSFTLIDEGFNASPVATKAALQVLSVARGSRHLAVLGDMLELGSASPELHAGLAEVLLSKQIDSVFCCGEMMTHLYNVLPHDRRGAHAATSSELASLVADEVRAGDVVLIKGSKGMHMEVVTEALKALECDDRKFKI
jgi:UDP-N-acetylmuramoyl-tripeptide--D-alanyl-D-alanine ligase